MNWRLFIAWGALAALAAATTSALAQEGAVLVVQNGGPFDMPQPMVPIDRAPPPAVEPPPPNVEAQAREPGANRPGRDDREGLERARAAARAAGEGQDDLDRARAAARAADPPRSPPPTAPRSPGAIGGKDCLSGREARGAISDKRAVTLSQAVRSAREAWDGEVIDYKLCTYDGALAYELTLLNGDGKVARVRVEAVNGKLVGVR
jgi:uncharacterized membrane protein YkoI